MSVLKSHQAVLNDPEPMVLVEELGAATVKLKVYFWSDISKHNGLKVKSSVIRLIKVSLIEAGISMPDEAREVVFPSGVPVRMIDKPEEAKPPKQVVNQVESRQEKAEVIEAEGNLSNDDEGIREQAKRARKPEGGENLLE